MPSSCPQISPWLLYLPHILVGVVVVFLVFFYFFSRRKTPDSQTEPSDSTQANANDTTHKSVPLGYPIRVFVERLPPSPSPSQKQTTEEQYAKGRQEIKFFAEIITAILALGLFVITWTYTKYTYQMWCEMQSQTAIQWDAFNATERPWVVFTGNVVNEPLEIKDGPNFSIKVEIRNTGKTPARKTRICIERSIAVDRNFIDRKFTPNTKCSREADTSTPVLAPGAQPTWLRTTYGFDGGQTNHIHEGTLYFYVWGRITYCDGIDKQWITNFCARMKKDTTYESCPAPANDYISDGKCRIEQENKQTQTH